MSMSQFILADLTDGGTPVQSTIWRVDALPCIDLIDVVFSPDGLLAGVFLQAGWDFLHGAPEGGRGGTRPADRHAHRRQQRVDKGNADCGRRAVLNTRQGLCSNGNGHISLWY